MLTNTVSTIVSELRHSQAIQISLSEESGSLHLSVDDQVRPIVASMDMEPFFRELHFIISKVVDLPSEIEYLYDSTTGKFIGYPGSLRIIDKDNSGQEAWDGSWLPKPGNVFNTTSMTEVYVKKPQIGQAKNVQIFNIAAHVLEAIIQNTRAYSDNKAVPDYSTGLRDILPFERMVMSPEQRQYRLDRGAKRDNVIREHVEQIKRERYVAANPVTSLEELELFEKHCNVYDHETFKHIYNDESTAERINAVGDEIHALFRKIPGFYSLQQVFQDNLWAIFAVSVGSRTAKPYTMNVRYCGDLRIKQWEREHLHEYASR